MQVLRLVRTALLVLRYVLEDLSRVVMASRVTAAGFVRAVSGILFSACLLSARGTVEGYSTCTETIR